MVLGGIDHSYDYENRIEFWSPDEGSCLLHSYPRGMWEPTTNIVSDQPITCFLNSCELFRDGSWDHLTDTRARRWGHSSAVHNDRVLLIGGSGWDDQQTDNWSTEWIHASGYSQPGPFNVSHGDGHCTIQVSTDLIVVTGGWVKEGGLTQDLVTEFHLSGDTSKTPLTRMINARSDHACGVYQEAGGQKVRVLWRQYLPDRWDLSDPHTFATCRLCNVIPTGTSFDWRAIQQHQQ